jgi:cytochrome c-type biogenesis protein CcmH/NrfG
MALLHAQIEEFDQTIAILQEAVTIEPNFVGGYQLLGDIFISLQRRQEAEQAYRQANHILKQYKTEEQNTEYARALLRSNK